MVLSMTLFSKLIELSTTPKRGKYNVWEWNWFFKNFHLINNAIYLELKLIDTYNAKQLLRIFMYHTFFKDMIKHILTLSYLFEATLFQVLYRTLKSAFIGDL